MTASPGTATAVLALDASTEACSVALRIDDRCWSRFELLPRGHAREMLNMVDAVLTESGLARKRIGLLAYSRGPGAFTGVRISVGVAQGLAWGLNVPVAGVSTLAALAQGARRRHGHPRVLAALDARMQEVYWAACAEDPVSGLMLPLGQEAVAAPADVRLPDAWSDCLGAGSGWGVHAQALSEAVGGRACAMEPDVQPDALDLLPHARHAWDTGNIHPAAQAAPIYLRNQVASPPSR